MKKALLLIALLASSASLADAVTSTVDYAAEARKLLQQTGKLNINAATRERLLKSGKVGVPFDCAPGDYACAARKLGMFQPSTPSVSLTAPPAYCAAGGGICRQGELLLSVRVAHDGHADSGQLEGMAFVHIWKRDRQRWWREGFRGTLRLLDRSHYRAIRIMMAAPEIYDFHINGKKVEVPETYRGRLCHGEPQSDCWQAVLRNALREDTGIDILPLLDRKDNLIVFEQINWNRHFHGMMLQLVRHDDDLGALPELCPAKAPPGCDLAVAETCRPRLAGLCMLKQVMRMSCDQAAACRQLACTGNDCGRSVTGGGAGEVQRALASLEMGRQASRHFTPGTYRLFEGRYGECRDKIAWGLGDCCRANSAGRNTSNRHALAQLGVKYAVRKVATVGSPHTHDVLYLTNDLTRGLQALGQGRLASLQQPLSFYGVKVSLAGGALKFSFDPASFAIAVALAVIANLLECSADEQLLGLRAGAGLCQFQRSWCSKRRWFSCKEEREAYCCYKSKIAKTLARQINRQLKKGNYCGGYSIEELQRVDFDKVDMSGFINDFKIEVDDKLLREYNSGSIDFAKEAEPSKP